MKRLELAFNVVSIFVDGAMLFAASYLAYLLRFRSAKLFPQYPVQFNLSLHDFANTVASAVPFVLIIISLYGLYNLKSTRRVWPMLMKIAASVSTGLMAFVAIYFFNPQIFPSRLIVLMAWVFSVASVSVGRLALFWLERAFLRRGIGLHKLVLIRSEHNDYGLQGEIAGRPQLGYKLIATVTPKPDRDLIADLENINRREGIDEILQADVTLGSDDNARMLHFTHDNDIRFNYVPNIVEAQATNIAATDIAGIPVIELKNTPLDGWGKVVKRICDILFSGMGLVVLSPVFALIALAIKLDSPGRVFFVQQRFGQGAPFKFYKFRSMFQDMSEGDDYGGEKAHQLRQELWKKNVRGGPFLKIKNDPRVTRLGRFLRATKLDELPQLINVLRGEMSLVGPRAHVLEEVNLYRDSYRRQFTIKPGITGLTQITQSRVPNLPFDEEIRLNTYYLENWSFGLDMKIMFNTLIVLFHKPEQEYY